MSELETLAQMESEVLRLKGRVDSRSIFSPLIYDIETGISYTGEISQDGLWKAFLKRYSVHWRPKEDARLQKKREKERLRIQDSDSGDRKEFFTVMMYLGNIPGFIAGAVGGYSYFYDDFGFFTIFPILVTSGIGAAVGGLAGCMAGGILYGSIWGPIWTGKKAIEYAYRASIATSSGYTALRKLLGQRRAALQLGANYRQLRGECNERITVGRQPYGIEAPK